MASRGGEEAGPPAAAFAVEGARTRHVADWRGRRPPVVSLRRLHRFTSRAFVLELARGGSSRQAPVAIADGVIALARATMAVVRVLQQSNVPHTFLLCRNDRDAGEAAGGAPSGADVHSDGHDARWWLRLVLWPVRRDLDD